MNNEYNKIRQYLKNTQPDVLESYDAWDEEQKALKIKEEITLLKAKRRNMIGFYKENYWDDEIEYEVYPSFNQTIHHNMNYVKQLMIEYIESLPVVKSFRGVNRCQFTRTNSPDLIGHKPGVYYTDGEFTINSITLLHIELYEIKLPQRFVDRAERANYDPVQAIKESIWENQDEILRKMFAGRVRHELMMNNQKIFIEAMSLYEKERREEE
tara:strand:- start:6020 stop:6655 length:636 start_codon:yes stop_codon:yes gene_type:complete